MYLAMHVCNNVCVYLSMHVCNNGCNYVYKSIFVMNNVKQIFDAIYEYNILYFVNLINLFPAIFLLLT